MPKGGRVDSVKPSPHDPGTALCWRSFAICFGRWSALYPTRDYKIMENLGLADGMGKNGIPRKIFPNTGRFVKYPPKKESSMQNTVFAYFYFPKMTAKALGTPFKKAIYQSPDHRHQDFHQDDLEMSTMGRRFLDFWIIWLSVRGFLRFGKSSEWVFFLNTKPATRNMMSAQAGNQWPEYPSAAQSPGFITGRKSGGTSIELVNGKRTGGFELSKADAPKGEKVRHCRK